MGKASLGLTFRQHFPRAATIVLTVLICAALAAAQTVTASTDPRLEQLERELARLAKLGGGKVGVGAIHLETGRGVYLNRDVLFPMASTYKVPIAVRFLRLVDDGQGGLEQMVTLRPSDLHPGSGILLELLDDPGVALSARNLLELMLLISDNSATDLVLKLAGGADAVSVEMRALGIEGIRVDRPTLRLIADWAGIANLPPEEQLSPAALRELMKQSESIPEEDRRRAGTTFNADPRDTSTPEAMARLLEKLWRGELLSQASTALLLDIMTRCQTGENRIKGFLPPGIAVAHKTGTIGGTTNDVGIITLPEEAGHIALAVFVKESEAEVAERERAIAQIARGVYDYFLFNSGKAVTVAGAATPTPGDGGE